jgi:HD-like signal output (HDOD) protein
VATRDQLSAADIEQLIERLERRLDDAAVPTLPHVAAQVIGLIGDDSASIRDFTNIIQTDRALSGRLLQLANSAFFAQRSPVSNLQRATVLIGLDRLKAVVLGFHLARVASGDAETKRVWTCSLFRAWLAHRLAERINRSVCAEAFVVGLLADAGEPLLATMNRGLPEGYPADAPPAKRYFFEFNKLEATHVDVAAALCRRWRLPDVLVTPIALHHSKPGHLVKQDGGSVLHACAFVVGSVELNPADGFDYTQERLSSAARAILKLDEQTLRTCIAQASDDFRGTAELFAEVIDARIDPLDILERANAHLTEQVNRLVVAQLDLEHAGDDQLLRLDAGGMIYEVEQIDHAGVRVFINDSRGNRLFSEQIDPASMTGVEIRSMLLLDDAVDAEFERVLASIRSVAERGKAA